ncbi:MAG TPA: four helix bundle protein [Anaerolineae bacterium]|nr:four helix bundle protein [Anaerolineae bacterium]HPL27531.1 four helix bundle protein [Anaerolineae bacterium]
MPYQGYQGGGTRAFRKLYGYKNLLAWQAADDLAALVHELVVEFKPSYWKLANQMLGSASSVKANIAEGYCRNALGDYIRFCEIARGSLGELGSQVQDCERWELVRGSDLDRLVRLYGDTTFFLEQLIKGLRAKRQEGTWDRSMGVKEASADYTTDDGSASLALPDDLP